MERAYDHHVVPPEAAESPPAAAPVRPARSIRLVDDATGDRLGDVQALRLGHGHRLAVESTRTQFEFFGGSFYLASRALSERLPSLGLTALQYDVWHTLLGVQQRGGVIAKTQAQIAQRLQSDRKEVGKALALFKKWGLIYTPRRGVVCLNPLIAFYGSSEQQQEALAQVPADLPHISLPSGNVRPRSKKPRTGPRGA